MQATRNFWVLTDNQLNTGLEDYHDALEWAVVLKEALGKVSSPYICMSF